MDRTEELHSVAQLYRSIHTGATDKGRGTDPTELSTFMHHALRVASNLEGNEVLVGRMEKLATMKEFSNDPTEALREVVQVFEAKAGGVQRDLDVLKQHSATGSAVTSDVGSQTLQHRQLVVQYLSKVLSEHLQACKAAAASHAEHLQRRRQRVGKYGQGLEQPRAGGAGALMEGQKYALFSKTCTTPAAADPTATAASSSSSSSIPELRQRRHAAVHGAPLGSTSGAGAPPTGNAIPPSAGATNPLPSGQQQEDEYDRFKKYGKARAPSPQGQQRATGGANRFSQVHRLQAPQHGLGLNLHQQGQRSMQQQQEQGLVRRGRDDHRLRAAEKAEATVAQMGQLFSRMASLVAEQGEVLGRIEDDVEAGLQDTVEAHTYMLQLQALTKGNRGMILKIFALLVFFIFLFLVWT